MSSVISTSYQASKVPSTCLVPQVFLISLPSYSLRKMKIASTFTSWNYSHWLTATTGWLRAEFGKSQQEHPVRISWLYGVYNEEYCIFYYYLQIVCLISHHLKKKTVKYDCFTARNKELKVVHFQDQLVLSDSLLMQQLQNQKVQGNRGRVGCLGFSRWLILLVNSKHKNGNRCAGKEETRCQ